MIKSSPTIAGEDFLLCDDHVQESFCNAQVGDPGSHNPYMKYIRLIESEDSEVFWRNSPASMGWTFWISSAIR